MTVRILHINIRASQGGAGRMCLDLHRRLLGKGHDSQVLYGYGSGIVADSEVGNQREIQMLGNRPAVLANYAVHRLIGEDVFTSRRQKLRTAIGWADIVHLHAPHHYFMAWSDLMQAVTESDVPVLATAHDWWYLTGRCGFVEDCTAWHDGCGVCGPRRHRDLPSLLDRSARVRRKKLESIRARGSKFSFVCPSRHLQTDYSYVYGDSVNYIPNAVDAEMEAALRAEKAGDRSGFLFSASDLSSPGKLDQDLLRNLLPELAPRLRFVGRNYPFTDFPNSYLGEIRGRAEMAAILKSSEALVFMSRMDNAPLTILEALSAGTYVVAAPSPAAEEMLSIVGGRCVRSDQEMADILRTGDVATLYHGISSEDLAKRSLALFSGDLLAERYLKRYLEMLPDGS